MGINATHIKNIERKIKDYNDNLTLFEQQFVIIPYLASGYIDYSNFGQIDQQRIIDNYETYKRLWTGNDSFNITWKDSVEFVNTPQDSKIKMNYKIGDAILGWLEQNSSFNQIKTDVSFNEYKAQTIEGSLTFRVNANKFKIDSNWEFMFFKVPELSKNILYRVESIEREFVGRDLLCYTLNLKSLNQDLANTGRAKQQNVMPNSPGQGYYDVSIIEEYTPKPEEKEGIDYKKFYDRWLVADKSKMFNNPVKKVVVKAFGLCGFSNITFWGRKVIAGGDFRDFGIPRIIFPINLTNASTYTLYRTQNEETNYYWCEKLAPIILFNKETFTALKDMLDVNVIWPSQGFFEVLDYAGSGFGVDNVKKTNPLKNGSYQYQLFGENESTGTGASKYVPWTITISGSDVKVNTDVSYGCAQKYKVSGTKPIHDIMFDAYWTQKNMKSLPITPYNTLGFGWTIGAAFAAAVARNFYSAAALMLLGLSGALIQKITAPKFQGFSCMVPSSLMDFMTAECEATFASKFTNHIKLSYFDSYERTDEIKQLFNTQTMNTSFEADLTDIISDGTTRYETTCIGQTTYDNGNYILPNQKPLLMDGTFGLRPINEENVGFIIDSFNIQAMFKGDYSIEFLDKQGSVIWSGVFQSQGKWTESLREINTWVNTSIYGRENMFLAQPLPWPKTPAELDLIGIPEKPIILEFEIGQHGKRIEFSKANATNVSFEQLFTSRDYFWWGFINQNNNAVVFKVEESGTYSLKSESKIVVKPIWNDTLDEFIKQYSTIDFVFNIFTPQNQTIEHELKNIKVDKSGWTFDFTISSQANNSQTFSMDYYVPQQAGGTFKQYNAAFNVDQSWSGFVSFEVSDNKVYMNISLRPTGFWKYQYVSYKYGRADIISYDEWKLYNRQSPVVDKFNSDTKLYFGSSLKRLVIQPAIKE